MELISLAGAPLSVPLLEPFVIATGTMVATRSIVVTARVRHEGCEHVGLGEAAALPPVTDCDQEDLLVYARAAKDALVGLEMSTLPSLAETLGDRVPSPVLRAGVEAAVLDAWGKAVARPVHALLGEDRDRARTFESDITIPIGEPHHMAELAAGHHARGFSVFKVKVGRDLDADVRALRAIAARVPAARFRVDANGGYTLAEARALLAATAELGIDCFEQPCARGDDDAAAALVRDGRVPIVADESMRGEADLARIASARTAHGINLKLAKLGSLIGMHALGRRARAHGLTLMCGAMVETRLGLTAALHALAAIGRAEYVDLDTQLLLAEERFTGGYAADGPRMTVTEAPGLGIAEVTS